MNTQRNDVLAELRQTHKRFGALRALNGLDLRLQGGELLAVLGPNGAGKSTAIGLLLGLIEADQGEAHLFGRSPRTLEARRQIGVMLQSAGIPEACKVSELLDVTRGYYVAPRTVADCIALGGLDGLLERRYGNLSGGQQRRVQFALAICGRPKLLVLDEPTTGLDIEARQRIWKTIRELVGQGCAVLLTTHYLEEAEALADRVVVLADGRLIAEGSVESIRARVSQRRIWCSTALGTDQIAAWPDVQSAIDADSPGRVEIVAHAAESVVRRLLAEDPDLADLEVHRAGLSEAFVELTREAA
jgi:ABC-2 type transport system ATP-binding protein